jgi:hypothetical protein
MAVNSCLRPPKCSPISPLSPSVCEMTPMKMVPLYMINGRDKQTTWHLCTSSNIVKTRHMQINGIWRLSKNEASTSQFCPISRPFMVKIAFTKCDRGMKRSRSLDRVGEPIPC